MTSVNRIATFAVKKDNRRRHNRERRPTRIPRCVIVRHSSRDSGRRDLKLVFVQWGRLGGRGGAGGGVACFAPPHRPISTRQTGV